MKQKIHSLFVRPFPWFIVFVISILYMLLMIRTCIAQDRNIEIPKMPVTFSPHQEYNFDVQFPANFRVNGTADFMKYNYLVSRDDSSHINTIVISGNVRLHGDFIVSDKGALYVFPKSECYISSLYFNYQDTVYNFGTLYINGFRSKNTAIIININEGISYISSSNGYKELLSGQIINGSCNEGAIIVMHENAIIYETSDVPIFNTTTIYNLSGRKCNPISPGLYLKNGSKMSILK